MNLLWTAFVIGFAGSLHCAAMCGPLVLRFGSGNGILNRLIYQFGKILAYLAIGLVFGIVGQSLGIFIYQQELSILTGIVLLLIVIYPIVQKSVSIRIFNFNSIYSKFIPFFQSQPLWLSKLGLGYLNGLLPCGLVYLAATTSVFKGNITYSILYMLFFGLGTMPMMLGISSLRGLTIFRFGKVKNIAAVAIAILFILRGMDLGIPYLSPKISKTSGMVNCACHKK